MSTMVPVRYGTMRNVGFFVADKEEFRPGDDVIVRTERGVEWGEVLQCRAECHREEPPHGTVLRRVTDSDNEKLERIKQDKEPAEYEVCEELIDELDVPMELVDVEHLFGGHKIIFFFTADGRVDFRDLVRELAGHYCTRIEMRQIGARDEARLIGLMGPCGRELCCGSFLNSIEPVPMKVAKSQKATLDPSKIGGCCGRLKCCLRYEDQQYRDLRENLPRRGTDVQTESGQGVVVEHEILRQTVTVQYPDDTETTLSVEDVSVIDGAR